MATIVQSPDTLSFSRNLKEIIISSSEEVSFLLKKGSSVLLEENYKPDPYNTIRVDIRNVVDSELSFAIPVNDITVQDKIKADFVFTINGDQSKTFTVIRGGVENMSDTTANFLKANFLTWQPQSKEVTYNQPEWLSFHVSGQQSSLKVRFYNVDGTTSDIVISDYTGDMIRERILSVNVQFGHIWALGNGDRYGYFDVWIEGDDGIAWTYVQRYILRSASALDKYYLCENSLGGIDTFRFSGDCKFIPTVEHTSLLFNDKVTSGKPHTERIWSQNTGMIDKQESTWIWELFRSQSAYHLKDGTIAPIILKQSSIEKSSMAVLNSYSFDYVLSDDNGLLNIPRSHSLPEHIEIPGPDDSLFFLAPRLIEYPDAALEDNLLIPVQTPFLQKWFKLSVAALRSFVSGVVTEIGHFHLNKSVLDRILGFLSTKDKEDDADLDSAVSSTAKIRQEHIRKDTDDSASGLITFRKGLVAEMLSSFLEGIDIGQYIPGLLGTGVRIKDGRIEADALELRQSLSVPTLIYNRVQVIGGEFWVTEGGTVSGIVADGSGDDNLYWLKLEDQQADIACPFMVDDILRGIVSVKDGNGDFGGFHTVMLRVTAISDDSSFSVVPRYADQPPVKGMALARQGNFTDAARQRSIYMDANAGYIRFLDGVNAWDITPDMIRMQLGTTEGTVVPGIDNLAGYNAILNNVIAKGAFVQVSSDGSTEQRVPCYKGLYEPGQTYYYYDQVSYNGNLYLCIAVSTTQTPAYDSTDWLMQEGNNRLEGSIISTAGYEFKHGELDTSLVMYVFAGNEDITASLQASGFVWKRYSGPGNEDSDTAWNTLHAGAGNSIVLTMDDIPPTRPDVVEFSCEATVHIDEKYYKVYDKITV